MAVETNPRKSKLCIGPTLSRWAKHARMSFFIIKDHVATQEAEAEAEIDISHSAITEISLHVILES